MRPTLETHRQRLQAACRRISEIPVEILMADDAGLAVHAGVAALASGRFIVLSSEFDGRDADFEMTASVCHELAHVVSRPVRKKQDQHRSPRSPWSRNRGEPGQHIAARCSGRGTITNS